MQVSPVFLAPSPLIVIPSSSPARVTIISTFSNDMINTEHIMTVTVSHAAPYRVVTADVYIKVLPSHTSLIDLQSQTPTRINPSRKVILVGWL